MKLKQIYALLLIAIIFSACSTRRAVSNIKINEYEINKYEIDYMNEYNEIKQKSKNIKSTFKWIQPKNKKVNCKIWVGINEKNDKTLKSDYNLYWDGECKDGFAYGIGREIEDTLLTNLQQIGYYENGKARDYCSIYDTLNGWIMDGECSYDINKSNHYVKTFISEKNDNLKIVYEFGVNGSINAPAMIVTKDIFQDNLIFIKSYPNFSYVFIDFTENKSNRHEYLFYLFDNKSEKLNGFTFTILENKRLNISEIVSSEFINGEFIRYVDLPKSYFDKAKLMIGEIVKEADIALDVQRKVLIIKNKYKKKICQNNIKVTFMDNDEYKKICYEDKYKIELQKKINKKLNNMEKEKQLKSVKSKTYDSRNYFSNIILMQQLNNNHIYYPPPQIYNSTLYNPTLYNY